MQRTIDSRSSGQIDVTEYGKRRMLIVFAVMLASLLETVDTTIVNVALPTIEGSIGASIDEGVWLITGYITANVIAIPLNPFLIRRFGRKNYFSTCIIGFTISSMLCSSAQGFNELVLYRILQGAFGGGLITTSQVVMRETFPESKMALSSALFAIALILGPAIGPLVGGFVTDNFSWQWIFDINVLPGCISAILIIALLRDPLPGVRLRIDWCGAGLLAAALGGLQFMLDNGERKDWFSDAGILRAGLMCVIGAVAFVWWELRGARWPIVDLAVVRLRSLLVGMPLAFALGMLVFVPSVITPLYSSLVLGYSPSQSGMLLVVRAIPIVIFTPLCAKLAERGFDVRIFLVTGFTLASISLAWLSSEMTSNSDFWSLGVPLAVAGAAQSMLLAPLIVGVLGTTPLKLNAKVSAMITLSLQLGGSVSTAAAVTLFDRREAFHLNTLAGDVTRRSLQSFAAAHLPSIPSLSMIVNREATTMGFADAILAVAAIGLVASILVFFFPRTRKQDRTPRGVPHKIVHGESTDTACEALENAATNH